MIPIYQLTDLKPYFKMRHDIFTTWEGVRILHLPRLWITRKHMAQITRAMNDAFIMGRMHQHQITIKEQIKETSI